MANEQKRPHRHGLQPAGFGDPALNKDPSTVARTITTELRQQRAQDKDAYKDASSQSMEHRHVQKSNLFYHAAECKE